MTAFDTAFDATSAPKYDLRPALSSFQCSVEQRAEPLHLVVVLARGVESDRVEPALHQLIGVEDLLLAAQHRHRQSDERRHRDQTRSHRSIESR